MIDNKFLYGTHSIITPRSKLLSVKQDKPNTKAWMLWCKALKLFATKWKLQTSLGKWLHKQDKLHRNWIFYYNKSGDKLYSYTHPCIFLHHKTGWRRHNRSEFQEITNLPNIKVPFSVNIIGNTMQKMKWSSLTTKMQLAMTSTNSIDLTHKVPT